MVLRRFGQRGRGVGQRLEPGQDVLVKNRVHVGGQGRRGKGKGQGGGEGAQHSETFQETEKGVAILGGHFDDGIALRLCLAPVPQDRFQQRAGAPSCRK